LKPETFEVLRLKLKRIKICSQMNSLQVISIPIHFDLSDQNRGTYYSLWEYEWKQIRRIIKDLCEEDQGKTFHQHETEVLDVLKMRDEKNHMVRLTGY